MVMVVVVVVVMKLEVTGEEATLHEKFRNLDIKET
jgi:hypothetical protein